MTPVNQRIFHNPPLSYGDCHRAAVASLLDIAYELVPHFMDGVDDDDFTTFATRESEFLRKVGCDRLTFPVAAADLDQLFAAVLHWNPGRYFLLGCKSKNGHHHTVIGGPNGVEHDPNPLKPGIAGPMEDGFFWVTYIVGAR